MKIITISGIIATWEMENEQNVTPKSLKDSLAEAGGEDVRIDINSPGGSVFAGLEMFSAIRNYSGHTETRVVSMAASMGSIIALAGNKKTAERTASYMIHNASGIAWGDHRVMAKMARELEAVSGHLSNIYTNRAGVENSEVREMMNEETWMYGEELNDFGFEIVEPAETVDMATAKFEAHSRYNNFKANIKPEEFADDLEKVAASIAGKKKPETINNQIKPAPNAGIENNNEENESVKNLEELKAQFPEVYALAIQAGIDEEKDRVTAHLTMGEAGNCMDLAVKNIKDGNVMTATVQAEYMAAGMKSKDVKDRIEDDPEAVITGGEEAETEAEIKEYENALGKGMRGKKK